MREGRSKGCLLMAAAGLALFQGCNIATLWSLEFYGPGVELEGLAYVIGQLGCAVLTCGVGLVGAVIAIVMYAKHTARRLAALLLLLSLVGWITVAWVFQPHDAELGTRLVPGTEQVAPYNFAISLSPDEQWLAFTEWAFPRDSVQTGPSPRQYDLRIATLDLSTGEIVRHGIESLPPGPLGFSPELDPYWKGQAGLEIVGQRFRPPGWIGQRFYFQPYYHGTQVALDAQTPGMEVVSPTVTDGSCSDCPRLTTWGFRGRTWDFLSDDVSAIVRDGVIRSVYYKGANPDSVEMIFRLREVGGQELLVKKRGQKSTIPSIASLRVTPDEHYLAYVFHGPGDRLFIRDLANGHEKLIGWYTEVSNLAWTGDGKRLYFAAGKVDGNAAVRIVDISAVFPK